MIVNQHRHRHRRVSATGRAERQFIESMRDDFVGHPLTATTVALAVDDAEQALCEMRRIVATHRLGKINHGWRPAGRLAVTFRDAGAAALFRLLFPR